MKDVLLSLKLLICIAISLVAPPANADILSASIYYQQGEFLKAKQQYLNLVPLGNLDAMYNLGVMNLQGSGETPDLPLAFGWFSLAADYGLAEGKDASRLIYKQFTNVAQLDAAYKKLQSEYGYDKYLSQFHPVYSSEQGQGVNTDKALQPVRRHFLMPKYPQDAIRKGLEGWVWVEFDIDVSGAVIDLEIIDAYPDSEFERAAYNAISRWQYESLVDQEPEFYQSRSVLYHFSTSKGKRYRENFSRQTKAYQREIASLIERAEQGDSRVQYHVANWLADEQNNAARMLKQHWAQPLASQQLLLSSAQNGYAKAQYRLAAMLLRGIGVEKDPVKGINWLTKAAEQGLSIAQYRLAKESKDQEQKLHWLTQAAQQQHFRAIRDLVQLLLDKNDLTSAQSWLKTGLEMDADNPNLLLLSAKLSAAMGNAKQAKKLAQSALAEASSRNWAVSPISRFIDSL